MTFVKLYQVIFKKNPSLIWIFILAIVFRYLLILVLFIVGENGGKESRTNESCRIQKEKKEKERNRTETRLRPDGYIIFRDWEKGTNILSRFLLRPSSYSFVSPVILHTPSSHPSRAPPLPCHHFPGLLLLLVAAFHSFFPPFWQDATQKKKKKKRGHARKILGNKKKRKKESDGCCHSFVSCYHGKEDTFSIDSCPTRLSELYELDSFYFSLTKNQVWSWIMLIFNLMIGRLWRGQIIMQGL